MSYTDDYMPICKGFEGSIPFMYLDTRGNVTVGVGFLVSSPTEACAYPFQSAGMPATAQEVTAAWNQVKAMEPGHPAAFYEYPGCPTLLQGDIDQHLAAEIDALDSQLQARFPAYVGLPDAWKMALLDMAWNLGLSGLMNGYPKMIAAVTAGNGSQAAAECHRNGIGNARNAWTANQFTQ